MHIIDDNSEMGEIHRMTRFELEQQDVHTLVDYIANLKIKNRTATLSNNRGCGSFVCKCENNNNVNISRTQRQTIPCPSCMLPHCISNNGYTHYCEICCSTDICDICSYEYALTDYPICKLCLQILQFTKIVMNAIPNLPIVLIDMCIKYCYDHDCVFGFWLSDMDNDTDTDSDIDEHKKI